MNDHLAAAQPKLDEIAARMERLRNRKHETPEQRAKRLADYRAKLASRKAAQA